MKKKPLKQIQPPILRTYLYKCFTWTETLSNWLANGEKIPIATHTKLIIEKKDTYKNMPQVLNL